MPHWSVFNLNQIVAGVPFGEEKSVVQAVLDELKTISLVTGVRRVTQGEAPEFMATPLFVEGVNLAHSYGYSIDVCIKGEKQQHHVNALVDSCSSDIQWILDHVCMLWCLMRLTP